MARAPMQTSIKEELSVTRRKSIVFPLNLFRASNRIYLNLLRIESPVILHKLLSTKTSTAPTQTTRTQRAEGLLVRFKLVRYRKGRTIVLTPFYNANNEHFLRFVVHRNGDLLSHFEKLARTYDRKCGLLV